METFRIVAVMRWLVTNNVAKEEIKWQKRECLSLWFICKVKIVKFLVIIINSFYNGEKMGTYFQK